MILSLEDVSLPRQRPLTWRWDVSGKNQLQGENGVGKTTLMLWIARRYPNECVWLPQAPLESRYPLQVTDVIDLAAVEYRQVEDFLHLVELSHILKLELEHLSGGERQLLKLALLFARKAELYLLDEPFSAIDSKKRTIVEDYIQSISGTVIMVDHGKVHSSMTQWTLHEGLCRG